MAIVAGVEATERKRKPSPKGEMNLVKLIEQYGSEDLCRAYLEELRWPDGVTCPRCESKKISRIVKRNQFDCDSCRYQFSVRVGTVFHDSHLPLWKWFLATYMMVESKKGMSANQLKRTLNVAYKTAWYLCHRIRSAMDVADPRLLTGIVEVDETYVGGKKRGLGKGGQGSVVKNKTMVLGAIERGGRVRFQVDRRNASTIVLHAFVDDNVDDGATAIYTDQHPSYKGIGDGDTIHDTVDHSAKEWVRAEVHTNTVEGVWSLLKRSIVGSYHQLSAKHLASYLDEIAFRFNNRHNPFLFRDTLKAMLDAETLTYAELTEAHTDQ